MTTKDPAKFLDSGVVDERSSIAGWGFWNEVKVMQYRVAVSATRDLANKIIGRDRFDAEAELRRELGVTPSEAAQIVALFIGARSQVVQGPLWRIISELRRWML